MYESSFKHKLCIRSTPISESNTNEEYIGTHVLVFELIDFRTTHDAGLRLLRYAEQLRTLDALSQEPRVEQQCYYRCDLLQRNRGTPFWASESH